MARVWLFGDNVDTDQIVPKQFLKRIERTGYQDSLFYDWRFLEDGTTPNPDFELNAPRYQDGSILLTRDNFGCGSSREHAPWALLDYGFRCILAPSFADIFYNNCFNNGILLVTLPNATVDALFKEVAQNKRYALTVDLENQTIEKPDRGTIPFKIDPAKRQCLLNGWDQIGLTLRHEKEIAAYERAHGIA